MAKYDRIISVEIHSDEKSGMLNWMIPLVGDEFTSLLSLEFWTYNTYRSNIRDISSYNILCDMISRDKVIVLNLSLDGSGIYSVNNNKFLMDKSKLINAIKSTNTLKEIRIISERNRPERFPNLSEYHSELEKLLKEGLSMNYSVTELINDENCDEFDLKKLSAGYNEWWPSIKKRNEESQAFNKIISGDQKDDGVWNNNKCPKTIATKLLSYHFSSIPSLAFNKKGDRCFCVKCHNYRKDKIIYKRGKPAKRYALPIQWVRFGLKTDDTKCMMANVWEEWHVAFHGTTKEIVPEIFKSGLILLKPGDITMDCKELSIRGGHIKKVFKRYNKYSKQEETFDPNQIYMSPSIKYAGHGAYSKWIYCQHPDDKDRTIKVQFAFQLRVQPGSYKIGQETVGAAKSGLKLDVNFSNNELEWYTKHNLGIVLHGLLLHIKEVNVPTKRRKKYDISKDEDDEKGGPYSEKKGKSKAKFTAKFKYENKLYILLKMGLKIKEDRAKELLLRHDGDLNEILADIFK
eukprot:263506_1